MPTNDLDRGDQEQRIQSVAVVGAGVMGQQIAIQCAVRGLSVWMVDVSESALEKARVFQRNEMDKRSSSGEMNEQQRAEVLSRIRATLSLEDAGGGVDLAIETVPESFELKREVFAKLDAICSRNCILATNSSSVRISRLEDAIGRPDKVLNMHFFLPVWERPAVELMGGTRTSIETIERAERFVRGIGMIPLLVKRESTGFIFNRVWRAIKKESLQIVAEGVASVEDVDRAWMIVTKYPIGPFGTMDQVGLDVVRDIEMVYYKESSDESDAPPELLLSKIRDHHLGVKSGKGFYEYPNPAFEKPGFLGVQS